jgi:SAM-dependent methyltransferase
MSTEAQEKAKALWSGGAYEVIGERIASASEAALEAVGSGDGTVLLDVACGTGNASIPAALAGAKVTGLDLTPRLLDIARERAAEAGAEVEWVEGDAQDLPFEDASFDAAVSIFGSMFAPDHAKAAAELARVLKPGGKLAVAAWTPEGSFGQMFKTTAAHMPAPPEGFQPPILWGSEDHVREIFGGTGIDLEFRKHTVRIEYDSLDAGMTENEETVPPVVAARKVLEPEGKWDALRTDLAEMYSKFNDSGGDALTFDGEYLLTVGTKS